MKLAKAHKRLALIVCVLVVATLPNTVDGEGVLLSALEEGFAQQGSGLRDNKEVQPSSSASNATLSASSTDGADTIGWYKQVRKECTTTKDAE